MYSLKNDGGNIYLGVSYIFLKFDEFNTMKVWCSFLYHPFIHSRKCLFLNVLKTYFWKASHCENSTIVKINKMCTKMHKCSNIINTSFESFDFENVQYQVESNKLQQKIKIIIVKYFRHIWVIKYGWCIPIIMALPKDLKTYNIISTCILWIVMTN